mgnify:FL=1|tara:strand:+ start:199 stop:1020 length:822 start_codon:yes stop_codon:yes gene_type:complete
MNILVTGYKGFIGQNMCHYLMSKGHKVEGWDFMDNAVPDPSGYDWVIHLGAISDTTFTDVEQIMAQNFENSMRLLQTCDTMGTNIQYASSASVYGPTTHFTEDGNLLPQSPYAWSKYLFDRFVKQHLDDFKVIVQGFRYFNVYGPYEDHKGNQASPYTKFTKQAQQDNIIKVFEGSENFKRDFVCVNDICQVHEKMFEVDKVGIWNVGTGKPVSFDSVARTIADKHGAEIKYITMPDNLKSQYQKYTCADLTKLNSVIDHKWIDIKDYINDKT